MHIAAIVARGTEDSEIVVPVDIWRRAGFTVDVIAIGVKKITILQNGLKINADKSLPTVNLSQYSAIFLPGGEGHTHFAKSKKLVTQLNKFAADPKKWILAICAAPSVLGSLGLLSKVKATAYPGYGESFKSTYVDEPVVHDGKFLTAQGPGIALPFAIKAVELLESKQKAEEISAQVLYHKSAPLHS